MAGGENPLGVASEERAENGVRVYPNLRHIRLLDQVAAGGSLSKAAEAVRISQPAASQAISRLEDHYGGLLMERRDGGMLVTERGALVVGRARRVLEHLRAATSRIGRQAKTGKRISADLLETHVTIAQLRALAAFAAAGSFSAAARKMKQAEPSVQRAARELERIAGIPLFTGKQQAIRLTPTGSALSGMASLVLKELESALDEVRELDGRFDGRLVIGTLPLARTRLVPDAVAALTSRRPLSWVEIVDGPYDTLLRGLMSGGIDVIVGALRQDPSIRGIQEETLLIDGLSVLARSGHPLTQKEVVRSEDLSAYPWVLPREGTPTRAIFHKLVEENDIVLPDMGIIETGSLVALRGILLQTDRLTLLSPRQISYEADSGLLTTIRFDLKGSARPIGVSTRRGWKPTGLQHELLEALRKAAS